jgi:predicted nucleic acid-binding protein
MRLFVDSSVILDAVKHSGPHYEDAKYFLMLGYTTEIELWMSPLQFSEVLNVAAAAGRDMFHYSRELRRSINVAQLSTRELASAEARPWVDFNAAVVFDLALSIRAEAIITNEPLKYVASSIPVYDCKKLAEYLRGTQMFQEM